jgi:hypothetical protein
VVVLVFDRYWLGEPKQREQLNEASLEVALARRSSESITRTSTIEEVETLNPTDRTLRDGSFEIALSQALRASLRSDRPSGTGEKPLRAFDSGLGQISHPISESLY